MVFGQKLEILSFILFSKTGHNNVFCDLVDRKLAILDYKKVYLRKS